MIYVRLVHLLTNSEPSRTKSLGISASSWKLSDIMAGFHEIEKVAIIKERERRVIENF